MLTALLTIYQYLVHLHFSMTMLSSVLPVTNIDLNRFALSSSNYALSENNLIRKAWAPKLIVLINFFHHMFYLFPECIYLFILNLITFSNTMEKSSLGLSTFKTRIGDITIKFVYLFWGNICAHEPIIV